ncbi:LysR family transcriptional regulator [Sphingomonas abietis]|uniref:LysR family transcriptional regulator n=1 Tax=Sphingomonas abietis TaxID=3012344 RepID=A0ABY7NJC1_9SPHN|nr:LysR family transcriptional regulator [Sphingomonas abietis]WBO20728.1 LysR family transcriptional regulator [Sphingomonas abietis]
MFEMSQLRCFVAVAEQLHFGHAAASLNMTQPPLSRQIQLLERAVGAPLLERSSRSVRLTPAGRVFLPEARRILRLSESAIRWTQRVWRGEAGTLRIGFTAASGYGMLPDLMSRMRDAMPDVDVVLREMVTSAQVEALAGGMLDVGFVRPPVDLRRFSSRTYLVEKFVLAVPAGHALDGRSSVDITTLHDQPFIMFSPDAARYFHDILTDLFDRTRIQPRVVHQVGQMHSMLGLVDAGFGVAILPEAATRLHFRHVEYRPIHADVEIDARLELIWMADNDNPALARFLDMTEAASPSAE